jgi:lipoprotein signal peptidase
MNALASQANGAPAPFEQAKGAPAPLQANGAPHRPRAWFLIAVAATTLVADVVTKLWAVIALDGRGTVEVWRGFLDVGVARNRGAAFSMLRDAPDSLRRPLFIAISIAAIVFVTAAYRRLDRARTLARWGFALVLGGALGNLVDRIRDASVVDFIQAHATWAGVDHRWPVFNVADVAISLGVALLLGDALRSGWGRSIRDNPVRHGTEVL